MVLGRHLCHPHEKLAPFFTVIAFETSGDGDFGIVFVGLVPKIHAVNGGIMQGRLYMPISYAVAGLKSSIQGGEGALFVEFAPAEEKLGYVVSGGRAELCGFGI